MAKRRKTRKEKLSSDTRRQSTSKPQAATPSSGPLFTLSETQHHVSPVSVTNTVGTGHHVHLNQDLIKTAVLTISVIIAELILKFIVKI